MTQQTDFDQAVQALNTVVAKANQLLQVAQNANFDGPGNIKEHEESYDPHKVLSFPFFYHQFYVTPQPTDTVDPQTIKCYVRGTASQQSGSGEYVIYSTYGDYQYSAYTIYNRASNFSKPSGQRVLGGMRLRDYWYDTKYNVLSVAGLLFSVDSSGKATAKLAIADDGGGSTGLYFKTNSLACNTAIDLGSSTYQFKGCYLQNSPIVNSDSRIKSQIEEIPDAVFQAIKKLKFKTFKFNSAIQSKGSQNARKHFGVIAQQVIEAFQSVGLNAFDYGIVCKDTWQDQYQQYQVIDSAEEFDQFGRTVKPEQTHMQKRLIKPAGQLLSVRYEELFALYCAYLQRQVSTLNSGCATFSRIGL